jgi:formylglycine-generating enzyme required for sulfatase activity
MAGNVLEWTSEPFVPYPGNRAEGKFDPKQIAVRGGCYIHQPEGVRCSARYGLEPQQKTDFCGFRCVRDVELGF